MAGGHWADWTAPGLQLEPLFPIGSFHPKSECPHRGDIQPGVPFCCMVCDASGLDGHPALKVDPRTAPRPEPKVEADPEPEPTRAEKAGKPTSGKMARRRKARKLHNPRPPNPRGNPVKLHTALAVALLWAAPCLSAQTIEMRSGPYTIYADGSTVTVDVAAGAVQEFRVTGPSRLQYTAKQVVLTLGDPGPDPPGPTPPGPMPPTPPVPPPDPPGPLKTAAWLVCLWDDAKQTPELADIRNSRTLDAAMAPTKVVDYSNDTPDFQRFAAYLAAAKLTAPAYVFVGADGKAMGHGSITTEAALIEAARNLK